MQNRKERLMPNGTPRYVRCYDNNGKTFDRYTVVYTGRYRRDNNADFIYLGMSKKPFSYTGFNQHGFSQQQIDYPAYSHLGKKIKFADLPSDCQKSVIQDYLQIWNIK